MLFVLLKFKEALCENGILFHGRCWYWLTSYPSSHCSLPPSLPQGVPETSARVLRLPGVSSESASLGNSESACIRFLLSNPLILLFLGLLGALLPLVRITSLLMLWASVSQAAVSQTFCLCSIAGLCVSLCGGPSCILPPWEGVSVFLKGGPHSPLFWEHRAHPLIWEDVDNPATLQRIRGICSGHRGLGFSSDELPSCASDEKPSRDRGLGGGLLTR